MLRRVWPLALQHDCTVLHTSNRLQMHGGVSYAVQCQLKLVAA